MSKPPKSRQPPITGYSSLNQLVAGSVAGGTAVLLLHPLDLLKTRFQATFANDRVLFDVRTQLADLYRGGMRSMYRGFTANLTGSTVSWGLYFLLYRWMKSLWPAQRAHEIFMSSAAAGMLTVLVANPLWMAKTRICQPNSQYRTLLGCLRGTWRGEGIRGWYRGVLPGLFGTSHGAVQFVVYEEMKKLLARPDRPPTTGELLLMSSTSKVVAATATYPYQVVRCRVQLSDAPHRTVGALLRETWRHEGIRGFYKGIVPSTIRVLPGTCITFFVYERVSAYLARRDQG